MVKKMHNAYRAVSVSRFQNILQKGTNIVIQILNWGTKIGRDGVPNLKNSHGEDGN